jgi:predicted esterase
LPLLDETRSKPADGTEMTRLEAIEHETAPAPRAAVIILHGLGADGNDFVPVAHELELASVGPVRYVFRTRRPGR